jgi:hypothetical protein
VSFLAREFFSSRALINPDCSLYVRYIGEIGESRAHRRQRKQPNCEMHGPSATEIALIDSVIAHLANLARFAAFNVDEANLRVASTSLRYLLVEDMLARAWKASGFGGPMTFRAWCVASTQGEDAVAYCGGGEVLPGIPSSICWNATLVERSLDLKAFQLSARIQVGAVKVSTIELIQYVANTLGGAHFDPEGRSPRSRKPVFDLLRRLETEDFAGLTIKMNNRNLLHHEVLSVAQTLLCSSEVSRLRTWRPS